MPVRFTPFKRLGVKAAQEIAEPTVASTEMETDMHPKPFQMTKSSAQFINVSLPYNSDRTMFK